MRTTLDLDEALLTEAMKWTGAATKTATINEALKQIVAFRKRLRLIGMAGSVDLDATRKRK